MGVYLCCCCGNEIFKKHVCDVTMFSSKLVNYAILFDDTKFTVFGLFLEKLQVQHSSQFQGLCSMKSSSETLQNQLYFIYMKIENPKLIFPFFILCYFILFPMSMSTQTRAINREKIKQHKMKKATLGFRMYKIWQSLKHFAGTFC